MFSQQFIFGSLIRKLILVMALIAVIGKSQAQTSIPFELTRQGHLVIRAKINGLEGRFLFDTGAGLTLVSKTFADKAGRFTRLDGSYTAFRATGEQLTVGLYKAENLIVGKLVVNKPVLTVFDGSLGDFDGLISLLPFRDQPFTIDYINRKIVLETASSLSDIQKSGRHIPLQLDDSRERSLTIFTDFKVNDKLVLQFCIDSGAGSMVYKINSRNVPALGIDTANAAKKSKTSEFNPQHKTFTYQANLSSISVLAQSQIRRSNISASFIDDLIYDGIVSLDWIGKKITFDLQNHDMIVTN